MWRFKEEKESRQKGQMLLEPGIRRRFTPIAARRSESVREEDARVV